MYLSDLAAAFSTRVHDLSVTDSDTTVNYCFDAAKREMCLPGIGASVEVTLVP
jgi:hypothetical protein